MTASNNASRRLNWRGIFEFTNAGPFCSIVRLPVGSIVGGRCILLDHDMSIPVTLKMRGGVGWGDGT